MAAAKKNVSAEVPRVESGLDVVLLLLWAPANSGDVGAEIHGVTRLQKMLFLLWKEGDFKKNVRGLYNFEAYDFGPCMDDLYDDLEFGEDIGLIEVRESDAADAFDSADERAFVEDFGVALPKRRVRRDFSLTTKGRAAAKELFDVLAAVEQRKVCEIKRRYNRMSLVSLIRYVYGKYPEFAKNSKLSSWL